MTDYDKGFGIGGANRTDIKTDQDMALIEATQKTGAPKKERGWLWEPCPICDDDPVCMVCGFCKKHCACR